MIITVVLMVMMMTTMIMLVKKSWMMIRSEYYTDADNIWHILYLNTYIHMVPLKLVTDATQFKDKTPDNILV